MSAETASAQCSRGRRIGAAAGLALAASLFSATGALAQNCTIGPATAITNMNTIGISPAAISGVVGTSVTAADTAFLLQSEAFIGAPPNPSPNQQGGGIWVRGVGGQVDIKSSTNAAITSTSTSAAFNGLATSDACSQKVDETFAGVQFGSDVANLNVNGWNFHLGTTAGYLGSTGSLASGAAAFTDPASGLMVGGGSFGSTTQVPFFGGYAAATNGGFFIDGLLREEYYQTSLNAPGANLFGQNIDAHGWAFAGSVGYNWQVPNSSWFVEPSAGISISRITIDPFNYVTTGTPPGVSAAIPNGDMLPGTLQMQNIDSDIGRFGVRVGETVDSGNVIWQPFAAVSVWHEFGPNITSTFATCPGCVQVGATTPPTLAALSATSSTTTFGTFGQYSLGLSGAIAGTGWLGFVRVDYRDGSDLEGLSGTGGIRYQFSPEPARGVMPTKAAPLYKAPVLTAVNWTGFYIGGFGGADLGRADWGYTGGEVSPHVGGFDGGGDIGYNWQMDKWVFGVEGDLSGMNLKGGTACGPISAGAAVQSAMFEMTCNASADWLATVTGKVGYALWDRVMIYVDGGGAWTDERVSATCNLGGLNAAFSAISPVKANCTNPTGAFSNGFSGSSDRGGLTIGYGSEFALTQNWAAKAETDYVRFSDRGLTASDSSALNVGMHFWEAKIGVEYRFNGAPM